MSNQDTPEGRRYPTRCTSEFCGLHSQSCPPCPHYPAQKEFKAWKERTKARRPNPIWNPLYWEATIPDPEKPPAPEPSFVRFYRPHLSEEGAARFEEKAKAYMEKHAPNAAYEIDPFDYRAGEIEITETDGTHYKDILR